MVNHHPGSFVSMPYGTGMATAFHRPKRNKFGAVKTMANGILFDSKLEATEYLKLLAREQAGEIYAGESSPTSTEPQSESTKR